MNNNNNNRGPPGPAPNGDQYALSLLVNAAEGRDSPRQRPGSDPRFGDPTFNLRGLTAGGFGGGEASLEEQILLQQQGFGGGGASGALLNQLREHNLLTQLNQQQQLAALLGLGGGGGGAGSWNSTGPEMRQAIAAAQFRQSQQQAPPQLTQADILALSRSGALSGLFGGGGGGGGAGGSAYANAASAAGAYGSTGANAFGGAGDYAGSQAFAAELEGLQRLEELNRRQRLLSATSDASRPGLDRSLNASGMVREQQLGSPLRNEAGRKGKPDAAPPQDASKEEIEKTPGSVIVPCRARGMPMDHNFKVHRYYRSWKYPATFYSYSFPLYFINRRRTL